MLSRDDVAKVLQAMRLAYGAKFDRQWENVGMTELLAFWHDRLRDVAPDALRMALDSMLDSMPFPPTLPEFKALCRQFRRHEPAAVCIAFREPRNSALAKQRLASLREILREAAA